MIRATLAPVALAALLGVSGAASADQRPRGWDGHRHAPAYRPAYRPTYGSSYRPAYHHDHVSTRIFLDIGPLWWPLYPRYYYPYYPPPAVVVPQPSVTYVVPAPTEDEAYWYYCRSPEGYYPYVRKCPGGWLKVVPEAPED